jgi:hypothetical protein
MPKYENSCGYAAPATIIFNAVAQAVQSLPGWNLREVNPEGWYVVAAVSFNLWSYGENNLIQITEPTPGQPLVNVSSSSVFALIDWGKNKRNIDRLFAQIQDVLSQAGYSAAPQQAQTPPEVQPQVGAVVPQQAAMRSFCSKCGAPVGPEAKFCTGCGQQVTRE